MVKQQESMSSPSGFNEVGALELVVVRSPVEAMGSQRAVDEQWQSLNYHSAPDFARAVDEHQALVDILSSHGAQVVELPGSAALGLDSMYVRDAGVLTPGAVAPCAMGKLERQSEPAVMADQLGSRAISVGAGIDAPGRLEGGDLVWLDEGTVAIGHGYRTNLDGISQFAAQVGTSVAVEVVPLPHWKGENDVFHLMSMLSPVDWNVQLVYSPLLPVVFRRWLLERGHRLVEVPDEEFEAMACNVLALAPGKVLMLSGRPLTRARLEQAGIEVVEYDGVEISEKGEGGPTCLTRPIRRATQPR